MATQTLAEAQKLIQNKLVRGVVQDIITTNPFYNYIPWSSYTGQAVINNLETTEGDAQHLAVGGTITANSPAAFTQQVFTAVTTIGKVELNNLVQVQSQSDGTDQMAIEIGSKAKKVGRLLQQGMATGTGVSPELNSFHTLCDASQYTTASAGQALSFELLDELINLVKAKDGQVDFIMMPGRTIRSFKTLYRSMNGSTPEAVVFTLPNGATRNVYFYEGIPVFQNDYLSVEETANGAALTGGALTSVWAGTFDEGDNKTGIAMIYPEAPMADEVVMGISVALGGLAEDKDEEFAHVKSYSNLALFNRRGLARLTSINN